MYCIDGPLPQFSSSLSFLILLSKLRLAHFLHGNFFYSEYFSRIFLQPFVRVWTCISLIYDSVPAQCRAGLRVHGSWCHQGRSKIKAHIHSKPAARTCGPELCLRCHWRPRETEYSRGIPDSYFVQMIFPFRPPRLVACEGVRGRDAMRGRVYVGGLSRCFFMSLSFY